jgi:hypothetical protein
MDRRSRNLISTFVLVLAVPTTALAADWLLGWHSRLWQTVAPERNAQELGKLYQLRELFNQSNILEKRFDFAIQKLREKRAYWNEETVRLENRTSNPKHVSINFGPRRNPTLYDPYFKDPESHTSPLIEWRNRQIQS